MDKRDARYSLQVVLFEESGRRQESHDLPTGEDLQAVLDRVREQNRVALYLYHDGGETGSLYAHPAGDRA